ncbi:hypothetical protein [Halomonas denitrificans]|uniref:hypothetical protein n=1 Tax=Halomonas denitrificans TaxID=370769 RepID=UPI000D39245F|nr:hypothetical protein [Halomonas denitrificans]
MNRSRTAGCVVLLAGALLLAGCSYTPPRILSEPLIEIDGDHRGHPHRHERHAHRDDYRHYSRHDAWHDDHHDRDRYHDGRRYRDHHRRSRFCPPGLAMQGRC